MLVVGTNIKLHISPDKLRNTEPDMREVQCVIEIVDNGIGADECRRFILKCQRRESCRRFFQITEISLLRVKIPMIHHIGKSAASILSGIKKIRTHRRIHKTPDIIIDILLNDCKLEVPQNNIVTRRRLER